MSLSTILGVLSILCGEYLSSCASRNRGYIHRLHRLHRLKTIAICRDMLLFGYIAICLGIFRPHLSDNLCNLCNLWIIPIAQVNIFQEGGGKKYHGNNRHQGKKDRK